MGCSVMSHVTPSESEKNKASTDGFTERQKALVRKTWKYLSNDLTGYGTMVFLRIFELQPHIKRLFPSICDDEGEKLLKNPLFKGHASRFMQAVGAVVDNLDNLDEALAPLLIGLGRNHINFMGFRSEYFEAFTHAMVYVWNCQLKSKFNGEVKEAWLCVFNFIMVKLQEGYKLALVENGMEEETLEMENK